MAYQDLSNPGVQDVKIPRGDTMVYTLDLEDSSGVPIDLSDHTFSFEVYRGSATPRLTITGVNADDNFSVSFTSAITIAHGTYDYRATKTVDGVTSSAIRGKFKVYN